ncbi:domain of Kin17 curved DNA-binding protein-domain-containing protein [Kockovaella imperatae]|uniref:Domain of Kin17 curved DNA-binding protein-domain-containing protein n=1 Tax=Kockovaella imperatae TaxID=4999 RepID=A0A1Y1UHN0_9TREE|nr:domain of Kin17 curved DNA-binding protein-domain-containing protein [Kockovaella imperatae]ORX37570.1 domain of Kin17 curved DNA-binding protein-domain-containing protein [Kockovaella imperatae]
MGRAGAGTPKALANAMKAKGLGRLRWYCQICEKQCRDENGFQAHTRSEPHMRKMMIVGPKAGQTIAEFSRQFQYEFVSLLRTRHQTNRVRANTVYNEYIQDKHHVHMNATRWVTLNGFIMTLGKAGIVKVDEDEKGLWITWVDSSPETLAKQAALQKRDRAQLDGEERERAELAAQIARAKAKEGEKAPEETGLQKAEGEKLTLSLFPNPDEVSPTASSTHPASTPAATASEPTPTSSGISFNINAEAGPSKPTISFGGAGVQTPSASATLNPLKRPASGNVFKSAKSAKTESDMGSSSKKGYVSEAERLMKEDQARKANRQKGYQGMGPTRTGDGGRRFVLQ